MKAITSVFAILFLVAPAVGSAQIGPTVNVIPIPNIPVELAQPTISSMAGGFQQISYRVSNISQQRLIAAEVTWKYQFANGRTITSRQRLDFVFSTEGSVAPGASKRHVAGLPRGQTDPAPLDQATGEITFAEFADGTTVGSDQAAASAWVANTYQAQHNAYERLLAVYKAQGSDGLKAELASRNVSDTEQMGVLKEILNGLEQRAGISSVIARIEQAASVKLPTAAPSNP